MPHAPSFTSALPRPAILLGVLAGPVVLIFISSNFVNAGNMAFNMIFSRLMGPELFADLAIVLTIKLMLLGTLSSIQSAVSRLVAGIGGIQIEADLWRVNRICFVALWLALPVVAVVIQYGASVSGLGSQSLLLILIISLPFALPLCILRGVVTGRINVVSVVLSTNIEMAVRLGGGVIAWKAGLGIEGVTVAIALSIVAGWAVLRGALASPTKQIGARRPIAKTLTIAALPFAALQCAQVILLDGDVFFAKSLLSQTDAGYAAALSLFQRVQFFACYGLASVLLPIVVTAVDKGETGLREAAPVAALFACVAILFLTGVSLAPELLLTAMVGRAFAAAAPVLPLAGLASISFTLSYLAATFLAALGDNRGIWLVAGFVPLQVGAFLFVGLMSEEPSLQALMEAKVVSQGVLSVLLLGVTGALVMRRRKILHNSGTPNSSYSQPRSSI